MILCGKCGHQNPLGTIFCLSCGNKLEVGLSDVMGSVEETKAENRDIALFRLGRNSLSLCGFLLAVALIINGLVVPDLPDRLMPVAEPMSYDAMFRGETTWLQVAESASDGAGLPAPGGAGSLGTTLSWRNSNAADLLQGIGANTTQIQAWQERIRGLQRESGAFPGDDELASTALAVLALQAFPGDNATDIAAAKGRNWLAKRTRDIGRANSDLTRTLAVTALLEAGEMSTSELSSVIALMSNGDEPMWQALALPHYPANQRPDDLVAIRRAVRDDPLLIHLIDLFSDTALVEQIDRKLFSESEASKLDAAERLAWAVVAWNRAISPAQTTAILKAWSNEAVPPAAPAAIMKRCGTFAAEALAILAVTAPARFPVVRVANR